MRNRSRMPIILLRNAAYPFLMLAFCSLGRVAAADILPAPGSEPEGAGTIPIASGKEDSLPVDSLLARARSAEESRDWANAERFYQSTLLRDSSNLESILGLAALYEKMGRYEHARGLLMRAAAIEPFDEDIMRRNLAVSKKLSNSLHNEVDSLMAWRSFEQALPKISILITLEPENPDLYYKNAVCHFNLGSLKAALRSVEQAMRVRPDPEYHTLHQEILRRTKQEKLHNLLRQAAEVINPVTPQQKEIALDLLARIIELDPDNAWAKKEFLRISGDEGTIETTTGDRTLRARARANTLIVQLKRWLRLGGRLLADNIELLLVLAVVIVVFRSPLTAIFMRNSRPGSSLSGKLERFSFTEILNLINSHALSGILYVKGIESSGEIHFDKGEAFHCRSGRLEGKEAFRKILEGSGEGYFHFSERKPAFKRTIDVPLSLLIMDLPDRTTHIPTEKPPKKPKSRMAELLENRSKEV